MNEAEKFCAFCGDKIEGEKDLCATCAAYFEILLAIAACRAQAAQL